LPLPSAQTLSLNSFDSCKSEAEIIVVTKAILKDYGITDNDIRAQGILLKTEDDPENFEDDDYISHRQAKLEAIKKGFEENPPKDPVEEVIVQCLASPYAMKETDSPLWLKPFCLEFIVTTILDGKPSFETSDDWEEDSFLEHVNTTLESKNMSLSYDPEYDWEDTSGAHPLPMTLQDEKGNEIANTKYTFPDPQEFDQKDIMVPINELLAKRNLKFMDASWLEDEVVCYNWILENAKEADRLETKYGKLTEWYKDFPQHEEEEGEEGEEGEEVEEAEIEPPKRQEQKKVTEGSKKTAERVPVSSFKQKQK